MGSVVNGNFARSRIEKNELAVEAVVSPNLIDERVGERLRRRRVSLGINESELANAAESTVRQVRQWEDGISRIEAVRLRRLAEILGVNSAFFFAVELTSAAVDGGRGPSTAPRTSPS